MGIITKIEVQKNNKQRANVFVDEEFICGLSCETVVLRRLKVGEKIGAEELKRVISEDEQRRAFNDIIKALSRRMLTAKQAKEYLEKKIYIKEAVDYAVNKAEEYGYIDDEKYAVQYISCYGTKKGSAKLKYELSSKGITRDIIESALPEHDDRAVAYALLVKYLKGEKPADARQRDKAIRHLLSKGCAYSSVKEAMERVNNDFDDGEE
ncbi:MAG: RecX family transcriptional regulator [Clostridiales bacterium]|jgi:regulatory protein|nr:RecX family transcriptional regulator [Clostridiales bacterium]